MVEVAADAANADQIAFWNGDAGRKWVRFQTRQDVLLKPHGLIAIEAAALQAGENVLDIGCGCGGTTLEIKRRVGAAGRVTGIDISSVMLARARERAAEAGSDAPEFIDADAAVHDFPPQAYDIVMSRFGVMFFDQPGAAFANIRSALRPGGRLSMVAWRPLSDNPWVKSVIGAVRPHVEMPPRPGPEDPGEFAFGDPVRVERILKEAGFTERRIEPHDPVVGGAFLEIGEAVDFFMQLGPVSRLLADSDDAVRARVAADMAAALKPHMTPTGLQLKSGIWSITARSA